MKKQIITSPEGYSQVLNDIRFLLEKAKAQAYKAVDNIRVQTYWQIGERIVREELQHKERADYGKELIKSLANDLGFGKVNLHYMVRFYKTYPIIQTVSEQLSWSHYVELTYLSNKQERGFYENQSIMNRWSVRKLRDKINNKLYNHIKKKGKLTITKQLALTIKPEEVFKDTYNFNFLELKKDYSENDLKNQLLSKFERTLQEFGSNFFVGEKERKIIIDGTIHKIDLVLFHKLIRCTILADFKIGKFKAEYIGQMNKYISYYRENEQLNWERDTIGLILCEYKGIEEVHYALGNLKKEIFVAEYKTKLPSEQEIKSKLIEAENK